MILTTHNNNGSLATHASYLCEPKEFGSDYKVCIGRESRVVHSVRSLSLCGVHRVFFRNAININDLYSVVIRHSLV